MPAHDNTAIHAEPRGSSGRLPTMVALGSTDGYDVVASLAFSFCQQKLKFASLVSSSGKAGLIVAIFMHMAWERMALIYAILVPPLALGTLVWLMLIESDYTFWTRILFFDAGA